MKQLYALFLLQIIWGGVNAQTINVCANFCAKDLSVPILGLTIDSIDISYCKQVSGSCVTIDKFDVQYAENSCPALPHIDKCTNDLSALVMRVYYPSNHDYATCKLPIIILFHAGSYAECSSYTNPGIRALARKLAARGFVVFDVNYRVGVIADMRVVPNGQYTYPKNIVTYIAAQQWLAIYRALQDARGAIRSIIKMQLDGVNSDKYQIDTSKMFLGGTSAGSVLAMSAEYYKAQSKIDSIFPGVKNSLGPIDLADVYYANPDEIDYFANIKGVLNCWGSLVTPATQAFFADPYSFFKGQGYNLPPVISFHGLHDSTFNYQYQGVYFSPSGIGPFNIFYNTESRCLAVPYTVPPQNAALNKISAILIGSETIYEMLQANGISSEFYLDCQAGHGLNDDDPACTSCTTYPGDYRRKFNCGLCSYQSNYGVITANTQDKTYDYIAGRAATFFQAILGGIANSLNTTKFVECPNYRNKCTPTSNADNNGECANSDVCP